MILDLVRIKIVYWIQINFRWQLFLLQCCNDWKIVSNVSENTLYMYDREQFLWNLTTYKKYPYQLHTFYVHCVPTCFSNDCSGCVCVLYNRLPNIQGDGWSQTLQRQWVQVNTRSCTVRRESVWITMSFFYKKRT